MGEFSTAAASTDTNMADVGVNSIKDTVSCCLLLTSRNELPNKVQDYNIVPAFSIYLKN
jgi:hypothetical protein